MFLLICIAVGLVIGCLEVLILDKHNRQLPVTLIKATCGTNILALCIAKVALLLVGGEPLFPIESHMSSFTFLYAIVLFFSGFAWIFISGILDGKFTYVIPAPAEVDKKKKRRATAMKVISVVMAALGTAAATGTVWGKKTFGDITPDQMLVNMLSPTEGTSDEVMITLWTQPVLQTFAVTFIFAVFLFSKRELIYKHKKKDIKLIFDFLRRIVCFVLSIAMLVGGVAYGVKKFQLIKLYKMYTGNSPYIEDNFVDPRTTKMQFPEKKRNLIHIYLESMENSYLSEDMGGYLDENLLQPLTDLAKEGNSYVFSHTDNDFGGPMSTRGCTWSVASMVNQNAGIPMKVPTGGNSYGEPGRFMPGAVMIGDILNAEGYEQTLMFGATATFGGLRYMYESHGNYNIIDLDGARERGLIPQDYYVYWGYEDDKLYEFAKDELTRLYETGKPFNFVMETADTHFPDGYVGPKTPTPRSSQYANVIAYSASEVTKFIRWIQQQPFYENTTIVLIGDHLSMDTKFFENFDPAYTRTQFNMIINPASSIGNIPTERLHNRYWANFDMFPTVLASIGVKIDGDRLALGTNLFSGEKTLFERKGGLRGWEYANEEFDIGSKFYNANILDGDYRPFDPKNITEYK